MKGYKPDWIGHVGSPGAERSAGLSGIFQQSPEEVKAALRYATKDTLVIPPQGIDRQLESEIIRRTTVVTGEDVNGRKCLAVIFPTFSTQNEETACSVLEFSRRVSSEAIRQAKTAGTISADLAGKLRTEMRRHKTFVPGRFMLQETPWITAIYNSNKQAARELRHLSVGGGGKTPASLVVNSVGLPSEAGKINPKLLIPVAFGAGTVIFVSWACQATNMVQTPSLEKIVRETLEAMNATGIPQPSATQKAPENTSTQSSTTTESPSSVTSTETPGVTAETPTPEKTQSQDIKETQNSIENVIPIPHDLRFLDGREVSTMVSSYSTDGETGLTVALDRNNDIVAYYLNTGEIDMWVVNPLLEMGFPWNFGKNDKGELIQHNMLEQWGYGAYPIDGVKFIKADQLPTTFWDESDPVNSDNQHPWPQGGTLAVTDRFGNILMYYSIKENSWWYAGYQQELPGNMIYRQSGTVLETVGVRHFPVREDVWPGVKEHWVFIRRNIDWFAYTRRTGSKISLEEFIRRTSNGEVFSYNAWVYDLQKKDYVLVTLNQNTEFRITYTLFGKHDLSYVDTFDGDGNMPNGRDEWTSVQMNPDGSLSIIAGDFIDRLNSGNVSRYVGYIGAGVSPFDLIHVGVLAASDKNQLEGIDSDFFRNRVPAGFDIAYNESLGRLLIDDIDSFRVGPEFLLDQYLPLISPDVY